MLAQSGRVNKRGAKWQNNWRTKLKSAYTNATRSKGQRKFDGNDQFKTEN
jgi:hypothetical protein